MKNLRKIFISAFAVIAMGTSSAATDTINLTGSIADSVSVSFDSDTLNLGDMTSAVSAGFTVVANTDYTVSVPSSGVLTNTNDSDATLTYTVSASKANSTITVTPGAISANLAPGTYASSVTLTVAAA